MLEYSENYKYGDIYHIKILGYLKNDEYMWRNVYFAMFSRKQWGILSGVGNMINKYEGLKLLWEK